MTAPDARPGDQDRTDVLSAHQAMNQAMLDNDTASLDSLLDRAYTLTHMTGYVQPKAEWLAQIDSGRMRYHSARQRSRTVQISGDTAQIVSRDVVDATIWGSRGTWNLQLTTDYERHSGMWLATRTEAATF